MTILLLCSSEAFSCHRDSIVPAVEDLIARYPKATLKDIYKSAFQDRFGPGHIVTDKVHAEDFLKSELESASLIDFPYYESTLFNGNYVRVNLSVLKNELVPFDTFLDAFVESANSANPPTLEEWIDEWHCILGILESMNLNLPQFDQDKDAIESSLSEGIYMGRHSQQYSEAYAPHYRIVKKDIFEEKIKPFLDRQPECKERN